MKISHYYGYDANGRTPIVVLTDSPSEVNVGPESVV